MLLSFEQVRVGWLYYARRKNLDVKLMNENAVRAALQWIDSLQPEVRVETAATFFAFASFRRCFPGSNEQFIYVLAASVARTSGLQIHLELPDELHALYLDIMHKRMDWPEVRSWFSQRLTPIIPSP